ncbi:MAG: Nif3-like dinuclear metal center hexameric protein [Oscillospiraceae bacterium]|nr:Nif3-like dinuclear metal center hexameric protein [Oscillospiraceae bacterium]
MSKSNVQAKDVFAYLNRIAPVEMKMEVDNVGHLVGRGDQRVRRVLIALDITDDVIDEAIDLGAELIVAHHPVILAPLTRVTDEDLTGQRLLKMIRHDIGAICMHTNLDSVAGGVNDVLAAKLGLTETTVLKPMGADAQGMPYGFGRIGQLSSALSMAEFLRQVSAVLGTKGIRYHDAGVPVRRVAVMGGSGGSVFQQAANSGCDTFVSADLKHNIFLDARDLGINLIDGDHYATEDIISPVLETGLLAEFPDLTVTVSDRHTQPAQFFVAQ